jgi:hypothetical protein
LNNKTRICLFKSKLKQDYKDLETWQKYADFLRHVGEEKEACLAELRLKQVQRFNTFEKYEQLKDLGQVSVHLWGEVLHVNCGSCELWGLAEEIQQFWKVRNFAMYSFKEYPWRELEEIQSSLPRLIEEVRPVLNYYSDVLDDEDVRSWTISSNERLYYHREEDFYWLEVK